MEAADFRDNKCWTFQIVIDATSWLCKAPFSFGFRRMTNFFSKVDEHKIKIWLFAPEYKRQKKQQNKR